MSKHRTHGDHDHTHQAGCGHTAVSHEGHIDYLHDGHMHHPHGDHVDECSVAIGGANPAQCTPSHRCTGHHAAHVHGPGCGHASVPHGDHTDYLVSDHLHHPCGGHCDDHGPLARA